MGKNRKYARGSEHSADSNYCAEGGRAPDGARLEDLCSYFFGFWVWWLHGAVKVLLKGQSWSQAQAGCPGAWVKCSLQSLGKQAASSELGQSKASLRFGFLRADTARQGNYKRASLSL